MKVQKRKDEKEKVKKKTVVTKIKSHSKGSNGKPSKEKLLVVAQEIKYARLLSANDKTIRDRVLKALKKWLLNCCEKGYGFKEDDFLRVWKGLFYAVWMSDKPLVQEELCENIAGLLSVFPAQEFRAAMLLTRAGFRTMATEWFGIDQHRMDKFLMLARRYLRGSLRCLDQSGWSLHSCKKYAKMLSSNEGLFSLKTPHYARNATSLQLHIIDCFLEELAKISRGTISGPSLAALLKPFVTYTCSGESPAVCTASRRLLTALLRQSELGLQYEDKTRAWEKMGCPEGGPDALVLVSDDEEEPEGLNGDADSDVEIVGPLDPRAGRVDVALPPLRVPASLLADMLRDLLAHSSSKAHKRIKICLQRFETLAGGEYPLRVVPPPPPRAAPAPPRPAPAARALRALEGKLKSDTDELKLRGLSRKHRKRLLKKTRLGQSIVEEVELLRKTQKKTKPQNGEWLVESTTPKTEQKDTSNKENQNKKKEKRKDDKPLKRKLDGATHDSKKSTHESKKMKLDQKKVSKRDKGFKEHKIENKIKEKDTNKRTKEKDANIPHNQHCILKREHSTTEKIVVEKLKPKKNNAESPKLLINKLKTFSKQIKKDKVTTHIKEVKHAKNLPDVYETPKKVKFELKNNSMQKPVDYYKSVRQSPSIPFDSSKKPVKTNLKPSTPSPINPFFKKKLRMKQ